MVDPRLFINTGGIGEGVYLQAKKRGYFTSIAEADAAIGYSPRRDEMSQLGCYGCETGTVLHHQDGAKSWFECVCGKFTGPKIDMSDRDHLKTALEGWHQQAAAYVPPEPENPVDAAHSAMVAAETAFTEATARMNDAEAAWMAATAEYEDVKAAVAAADEVGDPSTGVGGSTLQEVAEGAFDEPDEGFDDRRPDNDLEGETMDEDDE